MKEDKVPRANPTKMLQCVDVHFLIFLLLLF